MYKRVADIPKRRRIEIEALARRVTLLVKRNGLDTPIANLDEKELCYLRLWLHRLIKEGRSARS